MGTKTAGRRLSELELRAWQGLLHAHHAVINQLDRELMDEHGLSFGSYEVLLRLARAPDRSMRMSELAAVSLISPSGLTRRVDRMVADGLVERVSCPTDARGSFARITDQGYERLRRAAPTHLRGIREHFTGRLSKHQLAEIADALEAVATPPSP
jgi:DNA-binding MarR family transcriptional regulator